VTTQAGEGLLAPSDIADLAGVSRAAVSNWRKRMTDFPQPTGGSADKPLFAASDVEAWLATHPTKKKAASGSTSEMKFWETRLWGVANLFRGRTSLHSLDEVFVETAVDLIEGRPSRASHQIQQSSVDELREVLGSIPRGDLAQAIDGVLERTSRALGKSAGEHGFVGSRTSTLLASLAADLDGGTLYDPACGVGVALLQSVDMGARPDRIVGDEINIAAAGIARGRAVLRGLDLELHNADVLHIDPDPNLRADVIIAEPPFGLRIDPKTTMIDPRLRFGIPPRSSGDAFWLQHVVAHLNDGGTGYVLTSPGMLFRRGAEAEIRRNLLRGGWVRAVIGLPGKMLPHTSIALALWVLGEVGHATSTDVLMVDASWVEAPENDVANWLRDEEALATVPHARVPVDELAAGDADLSPARWILADSVDDAELKEAFQLQRGEIRRTSAALRDVAIAVTSPRMSGPPPLLTVADLVDAGAIEVASARPIRESEPSQFDGRYVDASAVRKRDLSPAVGPFPPADAHELVTAPGDVLLTAMHDVQAIVDKDGGHIAVGSVYRIRVLDPAKVDPWYLADALAGGWNTRLATGTTIPRIPIRDIEVPVPSLEEQRAVHAVLEEIGHAKKLAAEAGQAAEGLTNTILTAARHGIDLHDSLSEGPT
jgi:hypothetical protein